MPHSNVAHTFIKNKSVSFVKPAAAFLEGLGTPDLPKEYTAACQYQVSLLEARSLSHRLVAALADCPRASAALGLHLVEGQYLSTLWMSREHVQELRGECEAIRTGAATRPSVCTTRARKHEAAEGAAEEARALALASVRTRAEKQRLAVGGDGGGPRRSGAEERAEAAPRQYNDMDVLEAILVLSSAKSGHAAHVTVRGDCCSAHEDNNLTRLETLSTLYRPIVKQPNRKGQAIAANEGLTGLVGYGAALDVGESIIACFNGNDVVHVVGAPADPYRQGGHHRIRIADHEWCELGEKQRKRFEKRARNQGMWRYALWPSVKKYYLAQDRADARRAAGAA